jgi:hypothetical protein
MRNKTYIPVFILISALLVSCTEEFVIETQTFESVLVVEATITNEFKQQGIKLSRTYALEGNTPLLENNATVVMEDNTGNTYNFNQNNEGIYVSDIEFKALPNVIYQLLITTDDGKMYTSNTQQLPPISQIEQLYGELVDDPKRGIGIQVYLDNIASDANYYRYEYEETYKIVAPYHSAYEAIVTNFHQVQIGPDIFSFFDTEFALRVQEEKTCFVTQNNSNIIQTSTNDLSDNIVSKLPIRFIREDDGIIRDRYSILVKQYTQSIEAYTFYNILNTLGNNESILSENQPGYIPSNIQSLSNPDERIAGYFEVASISQQRIFFNASDFNLPQPDYLYECDLIELDYSRNFTCGPCLPPNNKDHRSEIYRLLTTFEEENKNYSIIEVPPVITGLWTIVNPECGDCTSIGSNIQPDFWED